MPDPSARGGVQGAEARSITYGNRDREYVIQVLKPIMSFHSPTIRRQGCCSAKTNRQDTLIFMLTWLNWLLNSRLPMRDVHDPTGVSVSDMKLGHKLGIVAALVFLASLSASAADVAILRNGFAIRHERREARDSMTRLYLVETPDNYIDVPTADIVRFEELDSPMPPAVSSPPAIGLDSVVNAASKRNNLDPDLVKSVILVESGFDPNAVSPKGARGLMQLMPQTAVRMGVQQSAASAALAPA